MTYSLLLNLNQCPAALVKHIEEWAECAAACDGLFGLSAPHPSDPLLPHHVKTLVGRFAGKSKVRLLLQS